MFFLEQAKAFAKILRFELDQRPEGQELQVCEIGFNCGHSTTIWLTHGRNQTRVISFDLYNQWYSNSCRNILRGEGFGEKILEFVRGSSLDTVPEVSRRDLPPKCDIILVDGAHTGKYPINDLQNMLSLAISPDSILTNDWNQTTRASVVVMDDAHCSSWWCADVTQAWEWGLKTGALSSDGECQEFGANTVARGDGRFDIHAGTRGWCVGRTQILCPVCALGIRRDARTCGCAFELPT